MAMASKPKKYYEAQITLGFTPSDGDLIGGTINGVEVNGQWIGAEGQAILYRGGNANAYQAGNTNVPFCMIGFRSEKAVISLKQDSVPTTDYELHLYRYVPADIVQIPPEYVEGLEETTANANEALNNATEAQNTANTAKSTAEAAQSTADTAKSTADTAKSMAETAVKPSKQGENICWYWMKNPYSQYSTVDTLIGSTGGTALEIIVNEKYPSVAFVPPIYMGKQANFEFRRQGSVYPHPLITGIGGIVVYSSTSGSTKKFMITVDDNGTIKASQFT